MSALCIGLTGGVASGKSAVAKRFAEHGVPVIDADVVAREVVAPGSEGLQAVVAVFGELCLLQDGSLDRAAMRQLVFEQPERRKLLESLLHPRIRARMRELAMASTAPWVLLDIPLLAEADGYEWLHRVLVVDVPQSLQVQRLLQRDGIDIALANSMLAAQASREARLAIADDVLDNSGNLVTLYAAVDALSDRYGRLAEGMGG